MGDISSSLPVRGATGDLLVNLFDYAGATFNPATKDLQTSILAGVTGLDATLVSILEGVTGIAAVVATEETLGDVLAGVTGIAAVVATEETLGDVLAGVTGIEAIVATEDTLSSVLNGVTGLEATSTSILAGVTGLEANSVLILAGVTGLEATAVSTLAGVTGLEATAVSILAGVTGIKSQLPVVLGATAMAASLSVTMATDQDAIPVYITTESSSTPVVQFTTGSGVAYNSGITGTYDPAESFMLNNVHASGSGRIKVEVYVGAITGWNYNNTRLKWVGFNSTSEPNVDIDCSDYKLTSTTDRVSVVVTNYENGKAQDLYCTIVGDLL